MELSENDVVMLGTAEPGELVIMEHGVATVIARTGSHVQYMLQGCQVFHQCPNMAVTVILHSVIGLVPACERCKGVVS